MAETVHRRLGGNGSKIYFDTHTISFQRDGRLEDVQRSESTSLIHKCDAEIKSIVAGCMDIVNTELEANLPAKQTQNTANADAEHTEEDAMLRSSTCVRITDLGVASIPVEGIVDR